MVSARSGGIRHGEPATDLLLARPWVAAGLIHPPVVRQGGCPEPVGHPLRDGPRGVLSLRHARVRAGRHQISNRSAVPHQVHDLTASHPVNRLRQGGRIFHRQLLGIHASSIANRSRSAALRHPQPSGPGLGLENPRLEYWIVYATSTSYDVASDRSTSDDVARPDSRPWPGSPTCRRRPPARPARPPSAPPAGGPPSHPCP